MRRRLVLVTTLVVVSLFLILVSFVVIGLPTNYRTVPCKYDPESSAFSSCRIAAAYVAEFRITHGSDYLTQVLVPYVIAEIAEGLLIMAALLFLIPHFKMSERVNRKFRLPTIFRALIFVIGIGAASVYLFYVYSDMICASGPVPKSVQNLVNQLGGIVMRVGLPNPIPNPLTEVDFGLHGFEAFGVACGMFYVVFLNRGLWSSFKIVTKWAACPLIAFLTGMVVLLDWKEVWFQVANIVGWAQIGARTFQINNLMIGYVYGLNLVSNMALFIVSVSIIVIGIRRAW